jgi:hypothetical protein
MRHDALVPWNPWLWRLLLFLLYMVVVFLALGASLAVGEFAGFLVITVGLALPILYWEWRLFRRVTSREPEQIMRVLRKRGHVELRLPSFSSSAWDPTQGMDGSVSGPGAVRYQLVDESTLRFTYDGRGPMRDATTSVPAVLVPGTPEAVRADAMNRKFNLFVLAGFAALPTTFAVGYLASEGSAPDRAKHAAIAVVAMIVVSVVASRAISLVVHARRRSRAAEQES